MRAPFRLSAQNGMTSDRSDENLEPGWRTIWLLHIRKLVAHAPDRNQETRVRGIGLDAAAQAFDERVDAPYGDEGIAAPDLRQQRLAAEHDAGVGGEQVQQAELLVREINGASFDRHAATIGVDFDAEHADQ